jgi:ABC-type transport system, involved in lipoprotein release, permease component
MKVANGKILRKITWRTLKAGRFRNTIAIIAIALTATLFTTIFAIGGNMVQTMQDSTMRQVGTSSHAGFKYLTQAQYDHIAESPLIKDISYNIIVGGAENPALLGKQTEIRYAEDDSAKWGFSYPTVGRMPEAANELVCSTITLDALGIPHELGQIVPLEFSVFGKQYSEEFVLSGYYPGDDVMSATQVFLSREYVDSIVSVPEKYDYQLGNDAYVGTISADIWFANSIDIEGKLSEVMMERGYNNNDVNTGINWAYVSTALDPTVTLLVAVLALLVLISGYLIIYSIFAISVTSDIQFYGLLKTVGTTGRQIRGIVRGQALFLSAIGIPLGLVLGILIGAVLTPVVTGGLTNLNGEVLVSLHPLIFVFSALFSLVTVLISCRKPARIASKVSPVEALRYTDVAYSKKTKAQKKTRRVSPFRMAWGNVWRSPKRLIVVVVSLSLSLVLLASIISLVNGFDMGKYLEDQMQTDFAVADQSLYNAMMFETNTEGVDQEILTAIDNLDGLEASGNIYIFEDEHQLSQDAVKRANEIFEALRPRIEDTWSTVIPLVDLALETGIVPLHVYGMGELALETTVEDKDLVDKLESGNYALISHIDSDYDMEFPTLYQIGEKISLTNQDGVTEEFEIIGIQLIPYVFYVQHSHIIETEILLAENIYQEFYGPRNPMLTVFNVADDKIGATEQWLGEYCETVNPELRHRSLEFYRGEFEQMQSTYMICGGVLSFILALIGVLNFINTMTTSIMTRKRELATLQGIGMTGAQLKQMLFGEGLWYAVLTLIVTLTIGTLVSLLIIQGFAGMLWFFSFNFSIMPMLVCAPILLLLCVAIPLLCAKTLQKEPIIERLREVA